MTAARIDVGAVLADLPRFDSFPSVERLDALVDGLRGDKDFRIERRGSSAGGDAIWHVRFGRGPRKALFVGYPHPNEHIGGLTVQALLSLLKQRHPGLDAGVEWHVIPCIDPDGARLNEGWSQAPFSLGNYMRNFHRQAAPDQVDCSFPIRYKRLNFDAPIPEARVLMAVIDEVAPDFFYALHNNAGASGVWLLLSRRLDTACYRELQALVNGFELPFQVSAPLSGQAARFDEGIYENPSTPAIYDLIEKASPVPEKVIGRGATSWEYASRVNPDALSFISELPYVRHPKSGSKVETRENLRRLKLRIDADNKFIAAAILELWEKLEGKLDASSAFHKKTLHTLIDVQDRLLDGLPNWPGKTRDILFNPRYDRPATEGERFDAYMLDCFFVLCHGYEFVRLLEASLPDPEISAAIERLHRLFDEALEELDRAVDFGAFQPIDPNVLVKAQLGSGLIVLNSILGKSRPEQREH